MAKPSKKSFNKKSDDRLKTFQKPSKKPFKPHQKSDSIISKDALPIQLEDDVPDFPRGGQSSLSRAEVDKVRSEVDKEFETETIVLKKKRKEKMKKMSQSTDDDLGSLFGDGKAGKSPRFANKITLKNLTAGMKLWGIITEVNEKDLVVSLPGGLCGLVRASEAIDPSLHDEVKGDTEDDVLSTIYTVGQLVSCIVLQLDDDKKEKGKRKIWLSLRLALLHSSFTLDILQEGMVINAYVKSIEDHGYMLHFGVTSFTGFMQNSSNDGSRGTQMVVGSLVQGVVKSIDRTRKVVYLSSDAEEVVKHVTKDLKGIPFNLLIPGMMVNASVRSTLENGIMLSFLTFFTGTVDIFHLGKTLPTSKWKDEYTQNKKVNARILFIDPSTRAVGLTMNPHLVHNNAPPSLVKIGDIFDDSKVVRVDRGSGLLLEIPTAPIPTPAYVSVSDLSDKEVRKWEKSFKEGSVVRVRVFGFRILEGVATGVLKTSAFEGSVFTHSDVRPGMVMKAKVIIVDSFGAIVQFASGVKALCPLRHMSEFEIVKPRKKFQVGAELVFRVLGCKSKRITVTHKKTLVKSKLPVLSSYTDATEGLLTHGWITKIESHGCFVRFYNGVQGFAPRAELGLDPGSDVSSMYHVEQVAKCRVTSSVPASRRINLSFLATPARTSEDDTIKLGSLVSGTVERVTPHGIIVDVGVKGYMKGMISFEHLADNHGLASKMESVLKPGYKFEKLLVLDVENKNLILTAKYSLVIAAQQLPADASQVYAHSVVHGYICNVIDTGCFVRFIGRLTGFAPKNKAVDDHRADLSKVFYVGQSVRSNILDVNSETGRITLSLKQSLCSSVDASFIQEYFLLEEKIAKLQYSCSKPSSLKWVKEFPIGNLIEGTVHEEKESGFVISFQKYNDVFGFITHHQLGRSTVDIGKTVKAVILDVAKMDHLVYLSLKPEFVNRCVENSDSCTPKKMRKRSAHKDLEVHQTVNAVVEVVQENYLVLSIPDAKFALGYASLSDYNTQTLQPKQFVNGQRVSASVVALPDSSTAERLLLLLKSNSEVDTSSAKRAKKKSSYDVGSAVQAEVTEIKPLELRLKFGSGLRGRIHITEASDGNIVEDPFGNFKIGQTLTARIVSKAKVENSNNFRWDLSIKPSVLADQADVHTAVEFSYSIGQSVTGFVYKVDKDWAWLAVTRDVRAQLYILDSACNPSELHDFQNRFHIGKPISGYILSTSKEKRLLRLLLHPVAGGLLSNGASMTDDLVSLSSETVTSHICEGAVVGGRISKILPGVGGLIVQIDPHLSGKVHYTELADSWISNPLSSYHEGQFVKCKVLDIGHSGTGTVHVDLSLRSSLVGIDENSKELQSYVKSCSNRYEKIEDLHPDMAVEGYVKNITPKGCFIMLSRKLDAKILISNLSDDYVSKPEEEFPIGKLVNGRVVSLEPLSKRIEVSLRKTSGTKVPKSDKGGFSSLNVGEIISGRVKRIEPYGLFIAIDQSKLVGLCHVSELPEDRMDNIETKYKIREKVKAKILKVDEERQRISLGMKGSYFDTNTDAGAPADDGSDALDEDDSELSDQNPNEFQEPLFPFENGKHPVLAEVESRAAVLPLDVPLDETDDSPVNDVVAQSPEPLDNKSETNENKNRRTKKKEMEEREREIRAAEERLLQEDVPRTADDFEKLIRNSPNSSFIWIKYMAFLLSLNEVEKARSMAERALRTINIREEAEKLNVWVAYFNLENEYGNPPEDAVLKVFQRALQYCDPKKVHFALLGMYERTEQHKLADELLEKMIKKFKHSCKVWLRRIQRVLKQKEDLVQSVVKRALICLPKHKHIKFITQTAISEFKTGVPDRGRSMFEGMLREYPKRTDLWSVYLDQEIRLGDVDVIRSLFERTICLELPLKKMKFLFKKYLEFEKSYGDEERTEYVKAEALKYLEKARP
ncbi:rRNA biogenesis protein RRP5 isoform X2 [Cynara cardunculus var. scolymus]|uniref:rRNA biogenesis protein RRP5 isoform X2 n=1 Tax=Cynara cardunculus var. scolymus TaxID=59895 RepID=UPI000D628B50|nr:rRNA biogenesis protein RRP5 isoform X2 [Cynara cardunculus var. scolymus]